MYQVHATGDGEGHEIESEAPSLYGGPPNTKVVKCEAALSRNSGSSNSSNGSSIGIREAAGSLLRLAIGLDTPLVLQPYPFLLFEMAEYALPVPTSLFVTLRQRKLFRSVSERGTKPLVPVAYTTSK